MSVPAFLAAVHSRSADGARAALSPGFKGLANGRPLDIDGQVRLLESFWLGFPDGNFLMEPTGGSGRHVITWTFEGKHDGMYLGVPPTGVGVAFSGFIVAVSDATGIKSLDWKWDTKAFTKAVLGPDQVGDLEVKDHFRPDPSRRWHEGAGPRRQGKGGKPRKPGGQRQPGGQRPPSGDPRAARPEGAPLDGAPPEGQAPADGDAQAARPRTPGQPGPPSPPGQGKRRRRGKKGPRPEGATDDPPMTPSAPMSGPDGDQQAPSASSAPSADGADAAEPHKPADDAAPATPSSPSDKPET